MSNTDIPASQWPKPYLLGIFERALKEGCIRVGPFSRGEVEVKSLIAALNRIRRKSDKQHAAFILPEYLLITYTYEQAKGTLLVTYSSLPDDTALPPLTSVDPSELQQLRRPELRDDSPVLPPTQPASSGEPFDAKQLLDDLLAQQRSILP